MELLFTILSSLVTTVLRPAPRRQPQHGDIVRYATQTYRNGVLISSTPEIRFGDVVTRSSESETFAEAAPH